MKTNAINIWARLCGLTITLVLLSGMGGFVNAQEKGSAKGGALMLLKLNGTRVTEKSEPSNYKPMSCANCRDVVVQVRDTNSKGGARALVSGLPLTRGVVRHGCDGCGNEWIVSGHGKAKTSVASHKCTGCGAESLACCNTRKSADTVTKGMENEFEAAPLR